MKKILLTGASGFIGKNTIPFLLENDYEVHGFSRRCKPKFLNSSIHWHSVNILDMEATKLLVESLAATHILHLAWYTTHSRYWTNKENNEWVKASLSLLASFANSGGKRAVFAGTCAEYDWSQGACSEDNTPLKPLSLYSICKNSLREQAEQYASKNRVSFAWGRLFFLYGPEEKEERLVPSVIRALLAGKTAKCTHGRQVRDFIHVKDAASAFVALLDSDIQEPVNIASGNPVELRTIVELIAKDIGHPELVEWGAVSTSKNDPPLLTAKTKKLRNQLGWSPKYNLKTGLAETIQSYRK